MTEKIEIKKELTEKEIQELFALFYKSLQQVKKYSDLETLYRDLIQTITPAKEIYLLKFLTEKHRLTTVSLEKNIYLDISFKSMLSKCIQTKKAQFSNDIDRDTLYNEEIDNFLNYTLKNLLLIPLYTEDRQILGIIWAAIPQKNLNQYMQSDINHLEKISTLSHSILEQIKPKEKEKKDEKKNKFSVIKKLKSLLFK